MLTRVNDSVEFSSKRLPSIYRPGVWLNIVKNGVALQRINLNLEDLFTRVVGKGDKTMFWTDRWLGSSPLCSRFPDLYRLERNKSCTIANRRVLEGSGNYTWNWSWSNLAEAARLGERIQELQSLVLSLTLTEKEDSWRWEGDPSGIFSVNSLRVLIDNVFVYE
ncbi:hypothetical protein OSB04_021235 [Centaurea solstitialis]|uniref:Uncharacterized protein n=1 Tax=Centaurea solstitialis TaxID=347529 RepID=A0AA38W4Q5_9ASTR|nr:hypothetical protein OSB04_021235 [Centaurea solstitialis]